MKARTTILLILVCAALAGAWYYVSKGGHSRKEGPAIGAKLFPELPINDITKIVLKDTRGSLTIEKQGNEWVVVEYYGYPARFDGVAETLRRLYGMKVGQTQRVKPASLGSLELVDPGEAKDAGSGATLIECYTTGPEPVARLLVGKAHESAQQTQRSQFSYGGPAPNGQFVRMPGSDLVIIASEPFMVPSDPDGWADKQLFSVPNADIKDITVTDPAGASFHLYRPTNGAEYVIDGSFPTQQLKTVEANSVASGLSYFRVDRILSPADAASNTALKTPYTYVAKLYNGQVYTLFVSPTNLPEAYLKVAVAYDKQLAEPVATNMTPFEIEQEAKQLNDKWSKWTFVLDNYKASELRKPLEALLEPIPVETNAPPAALSAPAAPSIPMPAPPAPPSEEPADEPEPTT